MGDLTVCMRLGYEQAEQQLSIASADATAAMSERRSGSRAAPRILHLISWQCLLLSSGRGPRCASDLVS
jgi:hypothetical protein